MKNTKLIRLFLCVGFCILSFAREDDQIKIGNLALTTSQQPGPLFSFGQNVVDTGDIQLFGVGNFLSGPANKFYQLLPYFLYGFSDHFSLYIAAPIAVKFQQGPQCSSGLQDIVIQLEYAFYNFQEAEKNAQFTLVANASIPSGSSRASPTTGLGNFGFFVGITGSYLTYDWYCYASPGVALATKKNNFRQGNQYFYQFGIGRNLGNPFGSILTLIFEFNGIIAQKNINNNLVNNFSGGHIFYGGPTLWFSTERSTLQFGVALPIAQEWNNPLNHNNYFISFDAGWKFN